MLFQQLFTNPTLFFIQAAALVYAITIHEFSHVLAAKLQGDDTGERLGRLTLNPLAHLDILGTVLIFFIGFGWGKPAPYNPYKLSNQKWGPVIVGLAGPFSNIVSGIIFALAVNLLRNMNFAQDSPVIYFFYLMSLLNFAFTFFNLLPIPPLDGSKLFLAFIPDAYDDFKRKLEEMGGVLFIALIIFTSTAGVSLFGFIWDLGEELARFFIG